MKGRTEADPGPSLRRVPPSVADRGNAVFASAVLSSANLSLRVLSTLARFFILAFITKEMGVDQAGKFALFMASSLLLGQLIGLDYYTFSFREIAAAPDTESIMRVIRSQMVLYGCTSLVGVVFALVPFFLGFIEWQYLFVFIGVTFLEQGSQELYRVLVALRQPVSANICNFMRMGLWVVPVIALAVYRPMLASLWTVFIGWLVGGLLSIALSVIVLSRHIELRLEGDWDHWGLVRHGVRVAMPFFAGSLFTNLIEYSDRYFIGGFLGEPEVGAYAMLRSIANFTPLAVYFAIYELKFPDLIASFRHGEPLEFRRRVRSFAVSAAVLACGCAAVSALAIQPILAFMDEPRLSSGVGTFYLLLVGAVFVSASTGLWFLLNAMSEDAAILRASILGGIVSVTANVLLVPILGANGAALALIGGMGARIAYAGGVVGRRFRATGVSAGATRGR